MYRKSMREALKEAREYRDPVKEDKGFSSQQIKMAYGILNDPRYKQGNYSGAVRAIEKIAKGLSNHPDVANALKRANEELEESAAAREIDRTNTRKDSMDYQMYKKSAELLRKKDYKALGNHIHKSDTAPREYVMDVISKKEPATFKKIYGNQTGFLATMKPLSMGEELEEASKYLRYSDLLIQKGRMQRAGDKQGERLTDIEIEKEKKKLGIKEDLNQDDEKVIKKVKDMLKGASAKHAAQAKMIDKALKDEAFTKKDFDKNEDENDHTLNAVMLAKEFGSSKEIKDMEDIDKRHRQRGHINEPDYSKRNALVKKYYPRLK